jgi:protein-disulfide isomerase
MRTSCSRFCSEPIIFKGENMGKNQTRITLFGLQIALFLTVFAAMSPLVLAQSEVCVRGKPNAPIHIEVFSDYQCPACRAFYLQTMRRVFTDYADSGKVCVIYRSFPSFTHSREAARLARAALRLGTRQWGLVSDVLFESQPQWSESGQLEAVVSSVLDAQDMLAIRKLLEDPSLDDDIDKDAILGLELQVISTPTFFLRARGKIEKVEAALTYAAMQSRLDALLAETSIAAKRRPSALLEE